MFLNNFSACYIIMSLASTFTAILSIPLPYQILSVKSKNGLLMAVEYPARQNFIQAQTRQ